MSYLTSSLLFPTENENGLIFKNRNSPQTEALKQKRNLRGFDYMEGEKKNQFTVMKQRACQLNNMTTLVVFLNSFWTVKDLLRGGSCMALASVVVQSFFFSGDLLTGVIKTNASSVLLVHQYYMHWLQFPVVSSWQKMNRQQFACSQPATEHPMGPNVEMWPKCPMIICLKFLVNPVLRWAFLNSRITQISFCYVAFF